LEHGEVLLLCSFGQKYSERNLAELQRYLEPWVADAMTPAIRARNEEDPTTIVRSLDIASPRVVSPALYEAIRLTELCIVDFSDFKPNVLFEFGVRVAASPVPPVLVLAEDAEPVPPQCEALLELFGPILYDPSAMTAADGKAIVERHRELRVAEVEHPQLYRQLHEEAWQSADDTTEPVFTPMVRRLHDAAIEMLADQTTGVRPHIYPTQHRLTELAESNGVEHLVAAWFYAERRIGLDAVDDELRPDVLAVASELVVRLASSHGVPDAELAKSVFAGLQTLLRAPSGGMAVEDAIDHAELLQRVAKAYTEKGELTQAVSMLDEGVSVLRPHFERYEKDQVHAVITGRLAAKLADTYGQLGGVHRRRADLPAALGAYAAGGAIERKEVFALLDTYNTTNELVIEFLLHGPGTASFEARVAEALTLVRTQLDGARSKEWWAWADLGVLSVLLGQKEPAIEAFKHFRRVGARPLDSGSTRKVLAEIQGVAGGDEPVARAAAAAGRLLDDWSMGAKSR
jgi:hypothetical protein